MPARTEVMLSFAVFDEKHAWHDQDRTHEVDDETRRCSNPQRPPSGRALLAKSRGICSCNATAKQSSGSTSPIRNRLRTSYGPRRVPGCRGMSVGDAHLACRGVLAGYDMRGRRTSVRRVREAARSGVPAFESRVTRWDTRLFHRGSPAAGGKSAMNSWSVRLRQLAHPSPSLASPPAGW
jgi:hypothetical protein